MHAFDRLEIKKFGTAFPVLSSATPPGYNNIIGETGASLVRLTRSTSSKAMCKILPKQPLADPLPSPPDHTKPRNLIIPRANQQSAAYRNLTIDQKTLCQSVYRFRRDLETRKTEEVHQAKSSILARRGVSEEGVIAFLQSLNSHEAITGFYNDGHRFRKMQFDLSRAKEGGIDTAIQRVIDMFTMSNGGQLNRVNPSDVLVSISLGEVGVNYALASLHGTFKIKLVRK
ncbi:hypothetical protein DFQ26_001205, partial [Actinomortierella ambigua]